MSNSVFCKTMENLRNGVDIKTVRSNETDKIRYLFASPLCSRHEICSKDIDLHKNKLVLKKPVYIGMTILDDSKILMYDFFIRAKKKNNTVQGGSCCRQTRTAFCLKSRRMNKKKNLYDMSVYLKKHPLFFFKCQPKKGFGQNERRMCWSPHSRVSVSNTENVRYIQGWRKNMKKSEGLKKKKPCQERNNVWVV